MGCTPWNPTWNPIQPHPAHSPPAPGLALTPIKRTKPHGVVLQQGRCSREQIPAPPSPENVDCWWEKRRRARPIPAFPTLEGIRAPHFCLQQAPAALGWPQSAAPIGWSCRGIRQEEPHGSTGREEQLPAPPGPARTDGFIQHSSSPKLPQRLG